MSDEGETAAEGTEEEQEAPQYRLVVVRHAPLPTAKDLTPTLSWLVETLQDEHPALFRLSARTPAMRTVPVLDGDESHVEAFLSVSEIEWHFGRDPGDPTHRVVFFNDEEGARNVLLRVSFMAEGADFTGPGLVAELVLGNEAAGPPDKLRGVHLNKLFSYLVTAIHPDFGYVELPGHPDSIRRPAELQVGWITYLAHGEATIPESFPATAVVLREERGTKILATMGLAVEHYPALAKEIDAVREALHPAELIEPEPDDEPAPVPRVQAASYMGARPPGQFTVVDDESTTDAGGKSALPPTLPFAQPPEQASQPATLPAPVRPPTPSTPPPSDMPFQRPAGPTFGLPPPTAAPMPPPPDPGPRRPQTLVLPPSSPDAPEVADPSKQWGLPFTPPSDPNKDPKKGG